MDRKVYKSALYNTVYNAKLWMIAAFVLLFSNALLSYFVVTADTTEKTVVVPPNANKEFTVRGDYLDPNYLEMMTRYYSGLLLNYHRDNIQAQHDQFLLSVSPAVFPSLSTTLKLKERRVIRNDVSSSFHPMEIHVMDGEVVISGLKVGFIGSKEVSKLIRRYKFTYAYQGGKLQVMSYREVEKIPEGGYGEAQAEELLDLSTDNLTEGGSEDETPVN